MAHQNIESIRVGDRIAAHPNSVSDIFAEGRQGVVVGLPPWSNNRLVRWDGDPILMGFHYEDVYVVERANV